MSNSKSNKSQKNEEIKNSSQQKKSSPSKKILITIFALILIAAITFVTYRIYTDPNLSSEKTAINNLVKEKTGFDIDQTFFHQNEFSHQEITEDLHSEDSATENEKISSTENSSKPQSLVIKDLEIPVCPKGALTISEKNTKGVLDTPEKEDSHQIIQHNGYMLCYREKYEQPEWVCYTLDAKKVEKNVDRKDNFRPDPLVLTESATLADYNKSGYDRGHLAPSADLTYSFETMDESFFLSNMSPQAAKLNRGAWKDLEHEIRTLTEHYDLLYIVTGPILEKDEYSTIGKNQVAVPEFYYKALLGIKNNSYQMIGFIMPNKECEGTIWDYACTVDEVESRTKLDFFSKLDNQTEKELEKNFDISEWKFN